MQAFIISDNASATIRIRTVLLHEGLDCPAANVLSLDLALDRLTSTQPELIVLVMSPDADRALSVLNQFRFVSPCPVIAVGPTANARQVLIVLRSGASDYVDEKDPDAELK